MHRKFFVTVAAPENMGENGELLWVSSGLDAIMPLAGFKFIYMHFGSNPLVTFEVRGWLDDETFMLVKMKYNVRPWHRWRQFGLRLEG